MLKLLATLPLRIISRTSFNHLPWQEFASPIGFYRSQKSEDLSVVGWFFSFVFYELKETELSGRSTMSHHSASQARIREILPSCPVSPEELAKVYDKWAKDGCYDKDVSAVNKRGSVWLADEFEELFPEDRAEVRILDVAAGSGRAAVQLRRRGFTNLDALDPSQGMLDLARGKQLYNKYICALINDKPVDIPEDTYDAVVCVGAIGQNHLPAIGLVELLRLTKRGGVVAVVGIATGWNNLPEYSDKMTKLIKQLEEQRRLSIIKWTTRPGYMCSGRPDSIAGVIIILRKL